MIFGTIFTDTIDHYHFYIGGYYMGSCQASGFAEARQIASGRFGAEAVESDEVHIYTHFEHIQMQDQI